MNHGDPGGPGFPDDPLRQGRGDGESSLRRLAPRGPGPGGRPGRRVAVPPAVGVPRVDLGVVGYFKEKLCAGPRAVTVGSPDPSSFGVPRRDRNKSEVVCRDPGTHLLRPRRHHSVSVRPRWTKHPLRPCPSVASPEFESTSTVPVVPSDLLRRLGRGRGVSELSLSRQSDPPFLHSPLDPRLLLSLKLMSFRPPSDSVTLLVQLPTKTSYSYIPRSLYPSTSQTPRA